MNHFDHDGHTHATVHKMHKDIQDHIARSHKVLRHVGGQSPHVGGTRAPRRKTKRRTARKTKRRTKARRTNNRKA